MPAPRLWNEHAHGFFDRPATEHEKFQHVVERCRVAPAGSHNRLHLLEVRPEHRVGQHAFPCVHPVDVPTHRIDFTVMSNESERMRQIPCRKCVGAVTLVHEGQPACHSRIGQIGIIGIDLIGEQQSLVDDRSRRKGADVDKRLLDEPQFA